MSKTNRNTDAPDLFGGADDERIARTRNSMLWAAYADALGFISELVDERWLKRRTKGKPLDRLMSWNRRVGGRGGVEIELPSGCWSDDTQLRMAVSRAITHHGFDVEAFARVELPVWPSYALGGGRASKAAAANLGKPDALWYANTFAGWFNAGGNGAAMRIQPHVWSARDLQNSFMLDVISDSVCTHGHPRAIVGACFHAATLAHCLRVGSVPNLRACLTIADEIGESLALVNGHRSLGSTWLGLWEQSAGRNVRDEWATTVEELRVAIGQALGDSEDTTRLPDSYQGVSDRLGLTKDEQRGSGILTPVAAVALAGRARSVNDAVVVAVNALGTDTDTIGTMAGALLGACNPAETPAGEPLDSEFLLAEADRLVAIARGANERNHSYPDLLTWAAPNTQADALVTLGTQLIVEGLGPVAPLDIEPSWTPRGDFAWQWVRTEFGQTLLVKRRPELRSLTVGNGLTPPAPPQETSRRRRPQPAAPESPTESATAPLDRGVNLDSAVDFARQRIDDNRDLGYTVRRVARDGTLTDLVALVTAIRDDLRR
jgi:ADP-ribosylglycohydrolase